MFRKPIAIEDAEGKLKAPGAIEAMEFKALNKMETDIAFGKLNALKGIAVNGLFWKTIEIGFVVCELKMPGVMDEI